MMFFVLVAATVAAVAIAAPRQAPERSAALPKGAHGADERDRAALLKPPVS